MNRIWIKLYLEILDDPKMGRLSNHLWRRAVELFLLTGRNGNDGALPPVEEMAWALRSSTDEIAKSLMSLAEIGVVHEAEPGKWVVTHFEKRQYSESYERVKRYRNAKSNGESNAESNANVLSTSSSLSDSSSEGEGVGEGEPPPMPQTPKQAMEHPDIQAFQEICGRIPGDRDYALVIDTIRFLRGRHGTRLVDQVTPYWLAWSSRKNKQGRKYNPAILVWLTEWAVNGEIPDDGNEAPKPAQPRDPYASLNQYLEEAKPS